MKIWLIILMALFCLFSWPQKSFSYEGKCTLDQDGKFYCVHESKKLKFELKEWANAFCKEQGYDYANWEGMDGCHRNKCLSIYGTCLKNVDGTSER